MNPRPSSSSSEMEYDKLLLFEWEDPPEALAVSRYGDDDDDDDDEGRNGTLIMPRSNILVPPCLACDCEIRWRHDGL